MILRMKSALLNLSLLLSLFSNSHYIISADEIRCSFGFGSGIEKIRLSSERIDDNYCDCPFEGGIDEPNTGACSGAIDGAWSGINTPKDTR